MFIEKVKITNFRGLDIDINSNNKILVMRDDASSFKRYLKTGMYDK